MFTSWWCPLTKLYSYEPLAARDESSLVARKLNVVRSIGESMGMKRSEVDEILARSLAR